MGPRKKLLAIMGELGHTTKHAAHLLGMHLTTFELILKQEIKVRVSQRARIQEVYGIPTDDWVTESRAITPGPASPAYSIDIDGERIEHDSAVDAFRYLKRNAKLGHVYRKDGVLLGTVVELLA